jgi:hypothetical protein
LSSKQRFDRRTLEIELLEVGIDRIRDVVVLKPSAGRLVALALNDIISGAVLGTPLSQYVSQSRKYVPADNLPERSDHGKLGSESHRVVLESDSTADRSSDA